ncbi:MAG: Lipoprotein-releasing system ATP-binding protein LolD [Firmicutes bacterium ADurb.Bin300]|jgi:putative ABC transport system ATP-binding protein|nr:MAG: Lipoprotein-releasing system ATP-binding protein LolD [Firmicutes bacterium ADurb.Bin300]HOD02728.1 ABC transporter ATP-binding protein [Clostridiales bacterium]
MIELKNIYKTYNLGQPNAVVALNDVSLKIEEGEFIAIIGKSGAGKSTLMHILACVEDYEKGEYLFDDQPVSKLSESKKAKLRNKSIGTVFQDYSLIETFSAGENTELPLMFTRCSKKERKQRAENALREVGISKLYDQNALKLSGGQRQRAAIARAMIIKPRIILADEPTGALDSETSKQIMQLLTRINKTGAAVVIITHEKEISDYCNRKIVISDGRIVSDTLNEK